MRRIFAGAFSSFFHGLIDLFLLTLNFRLVRLIVNATGEWHFSGDLFPIAASVRGWRVRKQRRQSQHANQQDWLAFVVIDLDFATM